MKITAVLWVLLITWHGKSEVMPIGYETEQQCKVDAPHVTRTMHKAKWECYPVMQVQDAKIGKEN